MTFWETLILAVGFIFVLEGLGYAVAPKVMRKMITEVFQTSDQNLRTLGFIAVLMGLVVIWVIIN